MSLGNSSHGWPLWRRQITVLARQEIGRSLFSKRSLPVYLLALMPIGVAAMRAIFLPESQRSHPAHTTSELPKNGSSNRLAEISTPRVVIPEINTTSSK